MVIGCLACDLTEGRSELPGGRIHSTLHWVVEHCVGPLGVGTLIVKPFRHCVHLWELTDEEASELGPLLKLTANAVQAILRPDQIYICEWSHVGWKPGHLHFVVQPSWNHLQKEYERPGPFLQAEMFKADVEPPRKEIEGFCVRARAVIKDSEIEMNGT
jgi:diadenosine tetraphosphate (Ap4A) HIT family hydrolase